MPSYISYECTVPPFILGTVCMTYVQQGTFFAARA